jgi:hypothetical protein
LFLGDSSSRDGADDFGGIDFLGSQFSPVHLQKHINDRKRNALISVGEAMIACKPKPICRCQSLKRRWIGIPVLVPWPRESRFEIGDTCGSEESAVLID